MTECTRYETTCSRCEEPIYKYCHSQAGNLKAYAWTTTPEDSEDDPRWGTTCETIYRHTTQENVR